MTNQGQESTDTSEITAVVDAAEADWIRAKADLLDATDLIEQITTARAAATTSKLRAEAAVRHALQKFEDAKLLLKRQQAT